MSTLERDYEAILRRSLHAAADSLEPGGDGLQQIRARLKKPRPFVVAWLLADSELARPVFSALEAAADWYLQVLRRSGQALRPVAERFRPAGTGAGSGLARQLGWLRPAAAMGTAIFVVAAGVFAALELPQAISQTGALQLPFFHTSSSAGSGGRPRVNGSATLLPGGILPGGSWMPGSGSVGSSASCSPSPGSKKSSPSSSPSTSPSSTPSSTPSQSPSPSTSPTPTTTPSTTPSVTPTPTGSATSNPDATSTPGSAEVAGATALTSPSPSPRPSTVAPGLQVPLPYPTVSSSPCPSGSPRSRQHVTAARSAGGIPSGSLALAGPDAAREH